MESKHDISCGVSDHHSDCLCDVKVTDPVEVRYHFMDVWHADVVAAATGYDVDESRLPEFLEALAAGYDATRVVAEFDPRWLHGIISSGICDEVRRLLKRGVSIVDVGREIDASFIGAVAALTRGQASICWTWDQYRWLELEEVLHSDVAHAPAEIAAAFDITRSQAQNLLAAYGKRERSSTMAERNRLAEKLFAEHPDETAAEIRRRLIGAGYDASTPALRKLRQRWRERQQHLH